MDLIGAGTKVAVAVADSDLVGTRGLAMMLLVKTRTMKAMTGERGIRDTKTSDKLTYMLLISYVNVWTSLLK